MQIVIATTNKGKLAEVENLLKPLGVEVVSAKQVGVTNFPPENGETYEANAVIKAKHVTAQTGLPALADDSGLEVDVLGGAPGIYSARFGNKTTDAERIDYLLEKLKSHSHKPNTAHFTCCIVLCLVDYQYQSFHGITTGAILKTPKGQNGFGYDPVFLSDDLGKSFAEVSWQEKQSVSHRGRALRAFFEWLKTHDLA